jgi:thiol-disulfide isomerase/thioredoxin
MKSKLFVISAALILAGSLVLALKLGQGSAVGDGYVQEVTAQKLLEHIKEQDSPLVLVNFWASWCEPCKVEFPHILQVRQKYADKGLKVVFVSIDDPSELDAAEKFLHEQKVDFTTYYKGKQPLKFVSEVYPNWSGAVPMSLLFGADGKIIEAWEGDTSLEEFEMRVQRNLKGT